jgi:hypothetical protein
MQQTGVIQRSREMEECIEACMTCHDVCSDTLMYCLEKGGAHAEQSHVRLMLDCIQICHTSVDFMRRGSELHAQTCAACAAVCERCAQDCERFGDDEVMKACAEACRRCAESCRKMAHHGP